MNVHHPLSPTAGGAAGEGYTPAVTLSGIPLQLRSARFPRLAGPIALVLIALLLIAGSSVTMLRAGDSRSNKSDRTRDLRFAAQMARQGLWREALFRWERLLKADPDDPYLLNNVAVAKEALGDRAGARALYERAAAKVDDIKLLANFDLFTRGDPPPADPPPAPESPPQEQAP
jgi:tetratricopeptide (TPR) repeat protein